MNQSRCITIIISFIACILIIAHIFCPDVAIDSITVALLVLALVPWMLPLLKAIDLPGVGRIEFQDLEKIGNEAKQAGLLGADAGQKYSFETVDDPNLALSGLRIELERVLKALVHSIGINTRPTTSQYFGALVYAKKLSAEETVVLTQLIPILNRAAHGALVDEGAAKWAISVGKQIIVGLEAKI